MNIAVSSTSFPNSLKKSILYGAGWLKSQNIFIGGIIPFKKENRDHLFYNLAVMIKDWDEFFRSVKEKPYAKSLKVFLKNEYATKTVYPPRNLVYNAFEQTSPNEVKVVILGQDPYHNPGEAMGLCFSVPEGIPLPPSLKNIYKEIQDDTKEEMDFEKGDLTCWAKQGVLLLNAYLTVVRNSPLSHKMDEYDKFVEDVFAFLEKRDQPIVYLLWGSFAKRYARYVRNPNHVVIAANHPSPLSANRGGWFGTRVFSRCNAFLVERGETPIRWSNIAKR